MQNLAEIKRSYYDILGIRKDASETKIRNIHEKLALIYHPDIGRHLGVDARAYGGGNRSTTYKPSGFEKHIIGKKALKELVLHLQR